MWRIHKKATIQNKMTLKKCDMYKAKEILGHGKNHMFRLQEEQQREENPKTNKALQHKEKHKDTKEAYTDGSKSTGRKVGFAAVFTDITRRSLHSHSRNDSNRNSNERDKSER